MTNVLHESWEAGTAGAACTKSNTGWTQFINGFTFVADTLSGQGSLSGHIAPTAANAQAQSVFTARPAGYATIFLDQGSNPSVDTTMSNLRGAGNTKEVADLRVLATGALQIRNAGYVSIAQSAAGMVPVGAPCRIEWLYDSATAQQRVLLYKTDPFGSSPDYDSGLTATTAAGTVDTINLGAVNATTWSATFGDFNLDDTEFPSYGGGGGSGGTVGFRDSAVNPTSSTGTTATIVIPATTQVGDLMVLKCWNSGGGWTQTAPAGWTKKTSQSTASVGFDLWTKTAVAGNAGSTVTVTSNNTSGSYQRDLHIEVYSTAQIGSVASSRASVASAAHMTPQVTAIDPNAWVECGAGDRASPSSQSWTLPSNLTMRRQHFGSGGAAVSSVTATDDVVGSGPVGSNQITGTVSTQNAVTYSLVIEPATSTVGNTVDAGPDKTLEPWLTGAAIPATATGSPTGWSWQQMSPPDTDKQLALSGAATATVTFPTRPDTGLVVYKLRPAATYASGPAAYDDVNVTILPATEHFVRDDGVHVPILKQFLT